jgi:hypothetical protein
MSWSKLLSGQYVDFVRSRMYITGVYVKVNFLGQKFTAALIFLPKTFQKGRNFSDVGSNFPFTTCLGWSNQFLPSDKISRGKKLERKKCEELVGGSSIVGVVIQAPSLAG